MKTLILICITAATLSAQFAQFAVTDDGRLFFSTPLIAGEGDARNKVYGITSQGLSLIAAPGPRLSPVGPLAASPLASGDGSVTGYAITNPCFGPCMFALPRTTFHLQGAVVENLQYELLQISRDARFLLGTTYDFRLRLIQLPTQQTREFPQFFRAAGPQAITNTGAVLMIDARQTGDPLLYIPSGETPRDIPGTAHATEGILGPLGDSIAYERPNGQSVELLLTDPQGSAHRLIATAPAPFRFQPSFANDGTLVYLQPDVEGTPHAFLLPLAADPRPLLPEGPAATAAIISGNAQLVWLNTTAGQLLRVRTADSVADEIIPASPYLANLTAQVYPGSVIRLTGPGATAAAQVTLGDTPLVFSEANLEGAAFQLPWDYTGPATSAPLTIRGPESPFRQELTLDLLPRPTITYERRREDFALQAAHDDFHGIVSAADPARPGEIIHVFARNMGPVDRPVATGQPSPANPPARITTPFACTLVPAEGPESPYQPVGLVVPFAGLSPGSIGIYQIDVTIPAAWPLNRGSLYCNMDPVNGIFRGDFADIAIAATPPSP